MSDHGADRRRVTLTFDNGPTLGVTGKVLDVLAAHRVTATFFVVGAQLPKPTGRAPAMRAVAEGHRVGHHTATHTLQLGAAEDSDAAVAAEITAIEGDIDALAGTSETKGERLFRPYAAGVFSTSECSTRRPCVIGRLADPRPWLYAHRRQMLAGMSSRRVSWC
jgi:peptidoglycan/xylan/chitin deacetylase (PgdA/CDA1 family)